MNFIDLFINNKVNFQALARLVENRVGNVYCDMDGVLADLESFAHSVGVTPPISKKWDQMPLDTFLRLEPMPGADRLIDYLKKNFPDFIVLTATPYPKPQFMEISNRGWTDKKTWMMQKFGIPSDRVIVVKSGSVKKDYAVTNGVPNILIDDWEKNTIPFVDAGGMAVVYRNADQAISDLEKIKDR
jgi:5'(3')-deoxyribonucleotidase